MPQPNKNWRKLNSNLSYRIHFKECNKNIYHIEVNIWDRKKQIFDSIHATDIPELERKIRKYYG